MEPHPLISGVYHSDSKILYIMLPSPPVCYQLSPYTLKIALSVFLMLVPPIPVTYSFPLRSLYLPLAFTHF